MNIEFQAPNEQVKEWVLSFVRDKLIEFHQSNKDISRAQVYFREEANTNKEVNKVCEIDLTIYGNSLFVQRKAGSFEQASKEVLAELAKKLEAQNRSQNEPPDEITSTVKV